MNKHLKISQQIQFLINDIENIELNLAELPLPEHPKLPQFDRSIRVLNIDAKSKQEFISFTYEQVLKDKVNGEEVKIALPTPEWVIYKDTWSYLRNEQNLSVEALIDDPNEEGLTDKVKVSAYKYLLWLLKKNKIGFIDLLKSYLSDFVETHKDQLDKL